MRPERSMPLGRLCQLCINDLRCSGVYYQTRVEVRTDGSFAWILQWPSQYVATLLDLPCGFPCAAFLALGSDPKCLDKMLCSLP